MSKIPNVMIAVLESQQIKPAFGEPCNNCGWCCLTEVCPVGQTLVGTEVPCKLLRSEGKRHFCSLVTSPFTDYLGEAIAIDTGCDAKTTMEIIAEMQANGQQEQ